MSSSIVSRAASPPVTIARYDFRTCRRSNCRESCRRPGCGGEEQHARNSAIKSMRHADIPTERFAVSLSPEPRLRRWDAQRSLRRQPRRLPDRDHARRFPDDVWRLERQIGHWPCTLWIRRAAEHPSHVFASRSFSREADRYTRSIELHRGVCLPVFTRSGTGPRHKTGPHAAIHPRQRAGR